MAVSSYDQWADNAKKYLVAYQVCIRAKYFSTTDLVTWAMNHGCKEPGDWSWWRQLLIEHGMALGPLGWVSRADGWILRFARFLGQRIERGLRWVR